MKNVMQAIASLALLAGLAVGTIWALVKFVGLEGSLVWGGIIGAIAWAVRTNVERKHEYQRLLADKKREQYYEFLDFLNRTFGIAGQPAQGIVDNPEAIRELRSWSLRLTMIGSDDVVRCWNDLRVVGTVDDAAAPEAKQRQTVAVMGMWGALWLAMRRDCGHADTKLQSVDLLKSIVNDIETYRDRLRS